jgi:hypothetical protein
MANGGFYFYKIRSFCVTVNIEGNELVIRLPILELTPSSSGKTLLVASSRGNQKTTAEINGQKVIVGFNAYIYNTNKKVEV